MPNKVSARRPPDQLRGDVSRDLPPRSQTVGAALASARDLIDAADARVLLCGVVQRELAYLITHRDDPLDADHIRTFETLVARRAGGEPVAYLTGRREFYGLDFKVTPAVLIPRPETELLVDLALERVLPDKPCSVLDLGTGSGCVAIAIAKHRPQAHVTATDSSSDALALAGENARTLGVRNVELAQGQWFHAVPDRLFDLIVSNPPYIAVGDPHLMQGDLRFEPRAALISGTHGLDAVRVIVAEAERHLVPNGWFMFEHGQGQAAACRALLEAVGFQAVFTRRDLADIERVTGGRMCANSRRHTL